MPEFNSLVLINEKENKILKCQRKPYGGGSLPTREAICKSVNIYEPTPNLKTIKIKERLSTLECKNKFKYENGNLKLKSKLKILYENNTLKIEELGENKIMNTSINFKLENIYFKIDLKGGEGKKEIISEENIMKNLRCLDERFKIIHLRMGGLDE